MHERLAFYQTLDSQGSNRTRALKWMKGTTRLRFAESSYKSECQEKNLPRWLDADTFFGLCIQPNLF